jgi:WD40 repeat protein
MRWLKWGLWLGVHAALWPLLPPVPVVRLPADLRPGWVYLFTRSSGQAAWKSEFDRRLGNNFAFAAGGRLLVSRDLNSVITYDLGNRQTQMVRVIGTPRDPDPSHRAHDLNVSPDAAYAMIRDPEEKFSLLNLATGEIKDVRRDSRHDSRSQFTADGKRLWLLGSDLFIVDLETCENERILLGNMPEVICVAPDGRTTAVGISSNYSGSHFGPEVELGLELIDARKGGRLSLDDFGKIGQWVSILFSLDGRTLAGSYTASGFTTPAVTTWEIPTGRRLKTIEHAWSCGWCADGRLVVRTEDDDCYFADANLNRLGDVPLPSRLTDSDSLFVDEEGRFLLVKHLRQPNDWVQRIKKWINASWVDGVTATWECFDLDGRRLTAVTGWTGGYAVSPDGKYLAVGSTDEKFVNVYTIPRQSPLGMILPLMIAEIVLAISWTAWRRRARHKRAVVAVG